MLTDPKAWLGSGLVHIWWWDRVQDQIFMVDKILDSVLQAGAVVSRVPRGSHVKLAL